MALRPVSPASGDGDGFEADSDSVRRATAVVLALKADRLMVDAADA